MVRRLFPLFAVGLVAGCVPVTEPVSDIDKAEPDKTIVGKWTATKANGFAASFKTKAVTIDVPDVKGNPKGLMRFIESSSKPNVPELVSWFYTSTVGKHT